MALVEAKVVTPVVMLPGFVALFASDHSLSMMKMPDRSLSRRG